MEVVQEEDKPVTEVYSACLTHPSIEYIIAAFSAAS